MDERTRRLLTAPIGATLLRLAAPNVLVMLVQASIGLIETYFVAGLGTDALAGMALVFPLFMIVQMMSAGAMGGGIMSAVARALGGNRRAEAERLAWHAVYVAGAFGIATTLVMLVFGDRIYAAMGARDGSLSAALAYSHVVFAGALFLWLFNSLAAVIRGTGNMAVPATVMSVGAVVLIPLSPLLILGGGPVPALGIVGGGLAVLAYYVIGTAIFAWYLWSGRGLLRPTPRPARLARHPLGEILRVGLVSSVVSLTTNATIVGATIFVGAYGPAAIAGYGTGARLEYLLVPLVFGLGAPIGAMVGTAIGAGDRTRALRVAWTGAAAAGVVTGAIGISAALAPGAWLGLFGDDPAMIAMGSRYLQIVGPFYGFFGAGLSLYFASQGAGRVGWPFWVGIGRAAIAIGGGFVAVAWGFGIDGVFWSLALALAVMGLGNAAAVAGGAWFPGPATARDPAALAR